MKYYIAYGSNLNTDQMAYRCPDSEAVGWGVLEDYELVFNGVLTIRPKPGESVPVGIWKVTADDERSLDVYEGFPRLYRKETMKLQVTDWEGKTKTRKAIVYIMNEDRRAENPPTQYYYDTVVSGYLDFNFPVTVLNDAVKRSAKAAQARIFA